MFFHLLKIKNNTLLKTYLVKFPKFLLQTFENFKL